MDERSDALRAGIDSTLASLDEKLTTLEARARNAVDLRHQVSAHPWSAIALATLAGWVVGRIAAPGDGTPPASTLRASTSSPAGGWRVQLDAELDLLRRATTGLLKEVARDTLREHLPALSAHLDRLDRGRS